MFPGMAYRKFALRGIPAQRLCRLAAGAILTRKTVDARDPRPADCGHSYFPSDLQPR